MHPGILVLTKEEQLCVQTLDPIARLVVAHGFVQCCLLLSRIETLYQSCLQLHHGTSIYAALLATLKTNRGFTSSASQQDCTDVKLAPCQTVMLAFATCMATLATNPATNTELS